MTSCQSKTERLERLLSTGRSATALLQDFCVTPLRVEHISCDNFPYKNKLPLLEASPLDTFSFRHIRLYGDNSLLMEAWNAFIPSRLPPSIQEKLTDRTIPFGAALGEGFFSRHILESTKSASSEPCILVHQALLRRCNDGKNLAFVCEYYTQHAANLCYGPSRT